MISTDVIRGVYEFIVISWEFIGIGSWLPEGIYRGLNIHSRMLLKKWWTESKTKIWTKKFGAVNTKCGWATPRRIWKSKSSCHSILEGCLVMFKIKETHVWNYAFWWVHEMLICVLLNEIMNLRPGWPRRFWSFTSCSFEAVLRFGCTQNHPKSSGASLKHSKIVLKAHHGGGPHRNHPCGWEQTNKATFQGPKISPRKAMPWISPSEIAIQITIPEHQFKIMKIPSFFNAMETCE